jgi:hypothetical protein
VESREVDLCLSLDEGASRQHIAVDVEVLAG